MACGRRPATGCCSAPAGWSTGCAGRSTRAPSRWWRPSSADWLATNDIALIGADNIAVEATGRRGVLPPLHRVVIRDLGLVMLELLHLREPAEAGVHSGLLVVAPLRISRGVGSPVNPLLIA